MIFFLYLLILAGFIFSRGFFSFNGIFILLLAIGLFILITLNKRLVKVRLISPQILLLILSVFSLVMYGGLYQSNYILVFVSLGVLALNVFLAFFLAINTSENKLLKAYLTMFAIAVLVRLFMIWSSPAPAIDVYDYLKNGALGFMHGQNPYSMQFNQLYKNVTADFYSYLPGMIFLTLPFVAVFNDPRYSLVFAEIICALLIYKLTKGKVNGRIGALLILNNPISLYMIEQSYTEPLILLLLLAFAYFLKELKNSLTVFTLGFLLATKQYAIFLVPIVCRLINSSRRCLAKLMTAFLVAGIIILPFFFWNKEDFIHDAVMLQYNFPARYEGLSFFSFLYRFGISYNFIWSTLIIVPLLLLIYSRRVKNLSMFFFLSSFAFSVFFFFNKWAFVNYYYLVSQLILAAAVFREENL